MSDASDECAFLTKIRNDPNEDTHRAVFADWLDEHGQPQKAHAMRHGVVKRFGVDFDSPGGALTLDVSSVSELRVEDGTHSRTHADGWTVSGEVHEDYFTWVNEFEASHPVHGFVWGDFESLVFATSEEAFQHFHANHPPSAWDYGDI